MSFFSRTTWMTASERWIILDFNEAKNDMMWWYNLDHFQIICTLVKADTHADSHANTSSVNFYVPDAVIDA